MDKHTHIDFILFPSLHLLHVHLSPSILNISPKFFHPYVLRDSIMLKSLSFSSFFRLMFKSPTIIIFYSLTFSIASSMHFTVVISVSDGSIYAPIIVVLPSSLTIFAFITFCPNLLSFSKCQCLLCLYAIAIPPDSDSHILC